MLLRTYVGRCTGGTITQDSRDPEEFALESGSVITLRAVNEADEEFLLRVYWSSRKDELSQAQWEPGQEEWFVRWQFQMQRREYESRFPQANYDVILVDGEPAGRVWIGTDTDQIRLLDIALLPEFQNRGVGTLLLRWLMTVAARSRKPLRHMVFVLNNSAERFYQRLGFSVIEDLGGYKHMEWRPQALSNSSIDL